jgi:hypothetical protein
MDVRLNRRQQHASSSGRNFLLCRTATACFLNKHRFATATACFVSIVDLALNADTPVARVSHAISKHETKPKWGVESAYTGDNSTLVVQEKAS